jgi:hypothetical protein
MNEKPADWLAGLWEYPNLHAMLHAHKHLAGKNCCEKCFEVSALYQQATDIAPVGLSCILQRVYQIGKFDNRYEITKVGVIITVA